MGKIFKLTKFLEKYVARLLSKSNRMSWESFSPLNLESAYDTVSQNEPENNFDCPKWHDIMPDVTFISSSSTWMNREGVDLISVIFANHNEPLWSWHENYNLSYQGILLFLSVNNPTNWRLHFDFVNTVSCWSTGGELIFYPYIEVLQFNILAGIELVAIRLEFRYCVVQS